MYRLPDGLRRTFLPSPATNRFLDCPAHHVKATSSKTIARVLITAASSRTKCCKMTMFVTIWLKVASLLSGSSLSPVETWAVDPAAYSKIVFCSESWPGLKRILLLSICASFCLDSVCTERFSAGQLSSSGDSGGGGLNIEFCCWLWGVCGRELDLGGTLDKDPSLSLAGVGEREILDSRDDDLCLDPA